MSHPIWPIVTENLAEQLSAAQGGLVQPAQLLPYLPISLRLIEATLDELSASDRVSKQSENGLITYLFKESIDQAPRKFAPTHCIYSNEALDGHEFTVITSEVKNQIEAELQQLATSDVWPAEAVWEHELIYLANNLADPVSASQIAGHSRLSFKKVEQRLTELKERGAIQFSPDLGTWELPPMRYPRTPYKRNDAYIRQFPGALQEETEVRLLKGLSISLFILLLCFALAVTAKIAFPVVLFGGITAAAIVFYKIFRAPPKPLPSV
ncbi:MAG: hypothetical protein ACI9A1_002030 [Lentimonas sp.]|jgi:hypothetical protein